MSNPHPKNSASAAPADDRLRRDLAPAARGDRGIAEDAARADETGLAYSLSEMEALLTSEFEQVALPAPPSIPGWHVCWLTTGSQYDTVQKRQRLGYVPVTSAELPEFNTGGLKSAAFDGAITCNEMVLFKIRQERYQMIMQLFHHRRPLEEEASIYQKVQSLEESSPRPARPEEKDPADGYTQLGKNIQRATHGAPVFPA